MLILAEKPSVAKEFARVFECKGQKGFFQSEDGAVIVTYCVGHLFQGFEPQDYDPKYKTWRLEDLPVIPKEWKYKTNESVKEQAEIVLSLLKKHKTDQILIATDAGREGELIAREALEIAGITDVSRCKRFWVSEALTDGVIRNGVDGAKPLAEYDALSKSAYARVHADWLTGMNLSRIMSIGSPPPPLAVGRVQTAVLAAIAGRNNAAANFTPSPYKELQAVIQSDSGAALKTLLLNPQTGKNSFSTAEKDAEFLHNALVSCEGKKIDNTEVKSELKKQKPEKLLNITGLQKTAYKKFGYKPDETLAAAQALYEKHKCLSYPRTPSRVMGDNNAPLFLEKFNLLKDASPLSAFCDPALISADNKHIFDSSKLEDHHALIPLDKIPDDADEKERAVYSIVLDAFFTVCMKDFSFNEKSFVFHAADYAFTAKCREVLEAGFKAAKQKPAGKETDEADEEAQEVSAFDESSCAIKQLSVLDKQTEPPKEFSLDTLLAFMEKPKDAEADGKKLAGLGTPATRADIIKSLFDRQYVREEKKKLFASDRAVFLLGELSKNPALSKIADVANTTDWEEKLASNPQAFEQEIVEYVKECCAAAPEVARGAFQKEALGTCPLCGKPVIEGKKSYSCIGWKDDPKCSFSIWKEVCGAKISPEEARLLLEGKTTKIKKCVNKAGKSFEAAFKLNKTGIVEFAFHDKKS